MVEVTPEEVVEGMEDNIVADIVADCLKHLCAVSTPIRADRVVIKVIDALQRALTEESPPG